MVNITQNFFYLLLFLSSFQWISSQTYELTGNPVNTSGWTLVSNAAVNTDFVQLTSDEKDKVGAIKLNDAINLNSCDQWRVEFDFRIDGNGSWDYGKGDGVAFWYLDNPPANYEIGEGLGIPKNAVGLMIGFDTFDNTSFSLMSKIHVVYGVNTGNIEFNYSLGSTYHTNDLLSTSPFIGNSYKHVIVTGQKDPADSQKTIVKIWIDGILLVNNSFKPQNAAAATNYGYFGFSAATGGASSRHSIKDVKIFIDKVPVNKTELTPVLPCPDSSGNISVDLSSYLPQIVSNPSDYSFSYLDESDWSIVSSDYEFSEDKTIIIRVEDPHNNYCDNDVKVHLKADKIIKNDITIRKCGTGDSDVFDLASANVNQQTGMKKEFYPSLLDLQNGTNEILNTSAYPSSTKDIFVKLINQKGCSDYAKIELIYNKLPVVKEAYLTECFLPDDTDSALFDLTNADVSSQGSFSKEYYLSESDAVTGTNSISKPSAYTSKSGFVYVKVKSADDCFEITKIYLQVVPPIVVRQILVQGRNVTINVKGGMSSYQYSIDGVNWQDSNVFTNLEGGNYTLFIKDSLGCNIAEYEFFMQNIPNVITPNDDGINDTVDFSLLTKKGNFKFQIFDRLGAQVFSSELSSPAYWDGKNNGRKVKTGTYWYVISWNENDLESTPVKYTGWIFVKNRN